MNKFKFFSLMGALAALSGCGMQQQNPAAFNQGFGMGGFQAGMPGQWGQTGWGMNGMWNGGMGMWNSAGQPIYNGNQVVGYRAQRPLMAGTLGPIQGTTFSQSVSVPAGSKVFVNTASVRYGANIFCDRRLIDSYQFKWANGALTNVVISLNGQPIGGGNGGTVNAPSGGTLTVSADLAANDGLRCGWGGNDRPFRVLNYYVNLGQGVTVESCTNLQGQQMPCP